MYPRLPENNIENKKESKEEKKEEKKPANCYIQHKNRFIPIKSIELPDTTPESFAKTFISLQNPDAMGLLENTKPLPALSDQQSLFLHRRAEVIYTFFATKLDSLDEYDPLDSCELAEYTYRIFSLQWLLNKKNPSLSPQLVSVPFSGPSTLGKAKAFCLLAEAFHDVSLYQRAMENYKIATALAKENQLNNGTFRLKDIPTVPQAKILFMLAHFIILNLKMTKITDASQKESYQSALNMIDHALILLDEKARMVPEFYYVKAYLATVLEKISDAAEAFARYQFFASNMIPIEIAVNNAFAVNYFVNRSLVRKEICSPFDFYSDEFQKKFNPLETCQKEILTQTLIERHQNTIQNIKFAYRVTLNEIKNAMQDTPANPKLAINLAKAFSRHVKIGQDILVNVILSCHKALTLHPTSKLAAEKLEGKEEKKENIDNKPTGSAIEQAHFFNNKESLQTAYLQLKEDKVNSDVKKLYDYGLFYLRAGQVEKALAAFQLGQARYSSNSDYFILFEQQMTFINNNRVALEKIHDIPPENVTTDSIHNLHVRTHEIKDDFQKRISAQKYARTMESMEEKEEKWIPYYILLQDQYHLSGLKLQATDEFKKFFIPLSGSTHAEYYYNLAAKAIVSSILSYYFQREKFADIAIDTFKLLHELTLKMNETKPDEAAILFRHRSINIEGMTNLLRLIAILFLQAEKETSHEIQTQIYQKILPHLIYLAEATLNHPSQNFSHLFYLRACVHERLGNYPDASADLTTYRKHLTKLDLSHTAHHYPIPANFTTLYAQISQKQSSLSKKWILKYHESKILLAEKKVSSKEKIFELEMKFKVYEKTLSRFVKNATIALRNHNILQVFEMAWRLKDHLSSAFLIAAIDADISASYGNYCVTVDKKEEKEEKKIEAIASIAKEKKPRKKPMPIALPAPQKPRPKGPSPQVSANILRTLQTAPASSFIPPPQLFPSKKALARLKDEKRREKRKEIRVKKTEKLILRKRARRILITKSKSTSVSSSTFFPLLDPAIPTVSCNFSATSHSPAPRKASSALLSSPQTEEKKSSLSVETKEEIQISATPTTMTSVAEPTTMKSVAEMKLPSVKILLADRAAAKNIQHLLDFTYRIEQAGTRFLLCGSFVYKARKMRAGKWTVLLKNDLDLIIQCCLPDSEEKVSKVIDEYSTSTAVLKFSRTSRDVTIKPTYSIKCVMPALTPKSHPLTIDITIRKLNFKNETPDPLPTAEKLEWLSTGELRFLPEYAHLKSALHFDHLHNLYHVDFNILEAEWLNITDFILRWFKYHLRAIEHGDLPNAETEIKLLKKGSMWLFNYFKRQSETDPEKFFAEMSKLKVAGYFENREIFHIIDITILVLLDYTLELNEITPFIFSSFKTLFLSNIEKYAPLEGSCVEEAAVKTYLEYLNNSSSSFSEDGIRILLGLPTRISEEKKQPSGYASLFSPTTPSYDHTPRPTCALMPD